MDTRNNLKKYVTIFKSAPFLITLEISENVVYIVFNRN